MAPQQTSKRKHLGSPPPSGAGSDEESSPSSRTSPRLGRKRQRIYTSCENCIGKKLKCNRSDPCGPCTMRDVDCRWIRGVPAPVHSQHLDSIPLDTISSDASHELQLAQREISRLEALVSDLSSRLELQSSNIDALALPRPHSPAPTYGLPTPATLYGPQFPEYEPGGFPFGDYSFFSPLPTFTPLLPPHHPTEPYPTPYDQPLTDYRFHPLPSYQAPTYEHHSSQHLEPYYDHHSCRYFEPHYEPRSVQNFERYHEHQRAQNFEPHCNVELAASFHGEVGVYLPTPDRVDGARERSWSRDGDDWEQWGMGAGM